jgi:non-ribosomal peptide synthetase component F
MLSTCDVAQRFGLSGEILTLCLDASGVAVTHRNVLRLFTGTRPWFDHRPDDIWTLFHAYAFDISVWEIWAAWLHGGRLVVVDEETRRSPRDFLELLRRERVTGAGQTPSAFYPQDWPRRAGAARPFEAAGCRRHAGR